MSFEFKRAERKKLKLKIGLTGPAGSGKSYTALRLATGLSGNGGKIALLNTERNRGEIYATEFEYDILELQPPYKPERFIEAIDAAVEGGYDVLILDSASHEWIGEGGVLDMNRKMQGNSFANWAQLTPRHDAFIDKVTSSDIHTIVCMRGKDDYVLEEDEKGKKVPKKIGLGPQQRDGFEYEFHIAFNLDMQHIATAVKDNSHIFDGTYKVLTEEDGKAILEWATSGKESPLIPLRAEVKTLLERGQGRFSARQNEYLREMIISGNETQLREAITRAMDFLSKPTSTEEEIA
jgi:GTPase SAR1 family protein